MNNAVYFGEFPGAVSFARAARKSGIHLPDPLPPKNFTTHQIEWCLKLVAHWEGGPHPDDPAAVPVKLELEES